MDDEGEYSEGLLMMMTAVVPVLVVAATAMPTVMVTAPAELVSVAMAATMLDLDHGVVLRSHRGDTQSGGGR